MFYNPNMAGQPQLLNFPSMFNPMFPQSSIYNHPPPQFPPQFPPPNLFSTPTLAPYKPSIPSKPSKSSKASYSKNSTPKVTKANEKTPSFTRTSSKDPKREKPISTKALIEDDDALDSFLDQQDAAKPSANDVHKNLQMMYIRTCKSSPCWDPDLKYISFVPPQVSNNKTKEPYNYTIFCRHQKFT